MIKGTEILFVKTPSEAATNYARVWIVEKEADAMVSNGPGMIPREAHWLICYKAAVNIATAFEADTKPFEKLYNKKMATVRRVLAGRFQTKLRYVKDGFDKLAIDDREPAFYDTDWD